ncbi:DUF2064 domain-containing protein [Patescibacteria group bacterium]|nr:DUF2064 domain-containing protein [Patescibacteria group bacterium]
MNKTKDNLVIVLVKKPTIENTKTRIAKDTSKNFAKILAEASISDLLNNIGNSNYFDIIISTDTFDDLSWFEKNYNVNGFSVNNEKKINKGMVINKSFKTAVNEYKYKKIILIPMDLPFVNVNDLISVFSRLENNNFVLGPEMNGGIYLIGMVDSQAKKNVFKNIRWSTKNSFNDLISNIGRNNCYVLQLNNDINTFQDILNHKDMIKMSCPKLYDLLCRNGYYLSDKKKYINFDDLDICIPAVSAIIERKYKNSYQILIQTRHKPSVDPEYSGLLEIPSGIINKYESASTAIVREVFEETGLKVVTKNDKTTYRNNKKDVIINNEPFLYSQQIKGGRSYINLSFLCKLKSDDKKNKLLENIHETRNLHWITIVELKKLLKKPNQFFPIIIPTLIKYLNSKNVI